MSVSFFPLSFAKVIFARYFRTIYIILIIGIVLVICVETINPSAHRPEARVRSVLPQRPDLKVIIMSATIDADRFAEHFSGTGRLPRVPFPPLARFTKRMEEKRHLGGCLELRRKSRETRKPKQQEASGQEEQE